MGSMVNVGPLASQSGSHGGLGLGADSCGGCLIHVITITANRITNNINAGRTRQSGGFHVAFCYRPSGISGTVLRLPNGGISHNTNVNDLGVSRICHPHGVDCIW